MLFVLLANHTADNCPLACAATRDLLLETASEIPNLAQSNGVEIVSGPYVNREHTVVVVVRADTAEAVDRFLYETRLMQWNTIRILPSRTMEEGMAEIAASTPIF
jgi:hypothetical protein